MNGIKDFITLTSKQLNEPEVETRQATGALLGTLKDQVNPADFQQLLGALPGASELLQEATAQPVAKDPVSGALGAVASKFGGAGAAGGALGLVGMIQKTGFSPAKIGGLVKTFMELVKGRAGDGLVKKLFTQLPELATLAA